MKFVCLGYFDESLWNELSEADRESLMENCLAYDDELRAGGHFLGGEALDTVRNAVTIRQRGREAKVLDGPYAETKEQLGGILLLEARDLNEAIRLMSRHPGLQVGPFEIRAADEEINKLVAARAAQA